MPGHHMVLVVPLVALIIVGALIYTNYASQQLAMHIHPQLSIKITYYSKNASSFVSNYILTSPNIGNPGGIMASQRYLSDGIDGFYPLHTHLPPCRKVADVWVCTIHVESRVVRPYTLGDFFEVWGQPLGRDNTLGYKANTTAWNGKPPAPFYWDMCIRDPNSSVTLPNADWGSHVLKDGELMVLQYSQLGCG